MRTVEGGVWKGNAIRRARKAGPCQYGRMADGQRCEKRIEVGDEYFEGEQDDWRAGGYAMRRYCMKHLRDD